MAQFFAPPDQGGDIYSGLGSLLGMGLGGLAQYGLSEYQRPQKIEQFKSFGFSEPEALAISKMTPQQQTQLIQQKIKEGTANKKIATLGNILSGKRTTPTEQPPTESVAPSDVDAEFKKEIIQNADQLTSDEVQQVLSSGLFNVNEVAQIQKILSEKERLEFERKKYEEGKSFKEKVLEQKTNAPLRKEIRDEIKVWHKDAKKADRNIHALQELKLLETDQDFTPNLLRKVMTKAGYGHYFENAKEEAYKKITEGLIIDKASELVSSGKMTAAILDRIRIRYPSLENTPEGRDIIVNILSREEEEGTGSRRFGESTLKTALLLNVSKNFIVFGLTR